MDHHQPGRFAQGRVPLALALLLTLLAAPLAAEVQQRTTVPRIGVLCPPRDYIKAFKKGLQELGWARHMIIIEERFGCSKEQLPKIAAEISRLDLRVIVTGPNPYIDATKRAATAVPIVMVYGDDPVGKGYIASLARPGGNITGLTWEPTPEIFGKYVEMLAELRPPPTRIAGIVDPQVPYQYFWKEAEIGATSRGMVLQHIEVRDANDVPKAFATITGQRADALIIFGGPFLYSLQRQISDLARKNRLPTVAMYREGPEAGGLMSYGTNLRESWRRAAFYVDKILKGAKPADLPVEQPTTFELVINLKTAKALGLTIPPSLLLRAHQVIE